MRTGAPSPRPESRPGSLPVLYACLFVAMIGYGITVTVLPYYAERIHGLSGTSPRVIALHIGLLTSLYALAQLLASPLIGRLGDRWGRRPVLLAGLAGMALTQAAFGLTGSLPTLYALRALSGLATAGLLVTASASVADLTSEADRARGMAWFGTTVSLGFVAGPLLGGALSRPGFSFGRGALRIDGFSLPFLGAALLALVVFFVALFVIPESEKEPGRVATPSLDPPSRGRSGLAALLALGSVSQFGLALFEGTFVLFARGRLSMSPGRAGLVFMVCGLVMAVLQVWAVGILTRFMPALLQVATGLALMGVGIAALVTTRRFSLVLVYVGVLAAGTALVTPNLSALVSTRGGPHAGAVLGLNGSAASLGQFVGPLLGGVLLGWHASAPFLSSGAVLSGTAVIVMALQRRISPATVTILTPVSEPL